MDKEQPLVDRLKLWPAVERGDALNAGFVSDLLTEAADALEALQRSNAEKDEALLGCGAALNSFIYIIAQRFDGDCTYYWMRDPTREEAQAAMIANNNASKALSHSSETSNG
jgi:hypothetical protein